MSVAVNIYVTDESVSPVPLQNVEVALFDPLTNDFVAGATTDVNGLAAFMVPGSVSPGTNYEVRAFKLGVNFHGLNTIAVFEPVDPLNPNGFVLTGADSNILPLSGSPSLCRCTGVFVDFSGRPIANKTIFITAQAENEDKVPKIWTVPSVMASPDTLRVTTDDSGRVSFDLLRTGQYWVTFGGDDNTVWAITVPDRYAVNFIDLIHPFPVIWDWDDTVAPGDAVTLAAGDVLVVPVTGTFTDYSVRTKGLEVYFDIVNSDVTIATAFYDGSFGTLTIRGLQAGTTTATPTLKSGIKPNRWPIPPVTAPGLLITVT